MVHPERVLLVEADSISNQLLSFSLQREGFQVVEARSGLEGLQLAREQAVDVILSEVLLPEIDGYELCRKLRADWNTQRIPIVLVTSLGGSENRIQGLLAGADDYLTKPYDVRELMIRLRRLVETYSNCAQTNPLTKLPADRMVRAFVEQACLHSKTSEWTMLRIDLNHLHAFNSIYGYEAGDCMLRTTAGLLRELVHRHSSDVSFVGHEGHDDFIAVTPSGDAKGICEELIRRFDENISACYPGEHRENSYHILIDRSGHTQLVPQMALSIGYVTSDLCEELSYLEIREAAEEVLRYAKSETKSAVFANRRRLVGRHAAPRKSETSSTSAKSLGL